MKITDLIGEKDESRNSVSGDVRKRRKRALDKAIIGAFLFGFFCGAIVTYKFF